MTFPTRAHLRRGGFHTPRAFTLLEILLCTGILAILLYLCAQTMITTLVTRAQLQERYDKERTSCAGWNILYQDLSNALGVYYLDGTTGALLVGSGNAAAPQPPKAGEKKTATPALAAMARAGSEDPVFVFRAESGDEPFLSVAVSQGRDRPKEKDLGFRLVRYYLRDHPEGQGRLLLRTEEPFKPGGGKKALEKSGLEGVDLSAEYRRFTVLEGLADVTVEVYNGEEWKDEWDSSVQQAVPLALRVRYKELGPDGDPDGEEKHRTAPIPISDLPVKEPKEPEP